jgi:hypothetical protein
MKTSGNSEQPTGSVQRYAKRARKRKLSPEQRLCVILNSLSREHRAAIAGGVR